jgi:hypothetical protein
VVSVGTLTNLTKKSLAQSLNIMTNSEKKVFVILIFISIAYFLVLYFPNAIGSADREMLAVFEPDEYAQYPHVIRMLKGGDTFRKTLHRFLAYQHYYYGFPFYAISAISIFPIKLLQGNLGNTPLVVLVLRQIISVLPMIFSILIFVYIQTRFRSYLAAIGLFVFLLTIPAVVKNNLWWHPDSLTVLFSTLTFFFLDRDDLRFGHNFIFAAVTCGLTTGTKLVGLFFFLTIPLYLLLGLIYKRIKLQQAAIRAGVFVVVMLVTIELSNPLLLSSSGRVAIISIQQKQAKAMSFGWDVAYAKGPASWFPIIQEYYGEWYTITVAILMLLVGIRYDSKRILSLLILSWIIPYSLYILYFIAIKPKHFFIPIILPLYSGLAMLPSLISKKNITELAGASDRINIGLRLFGYIALLTVAVQFVRNIQWDIDYYLKQLTREQTSTSINFYTTLDREYLSKIPDTIPLNIYRDIRVYVPPSNRWNAQIKW